MRLNVGDKVRWKHGAFRQGDPRMHHEGEIVNVGSTTLEGNLPVGVVEVLWHDARGTRTVVLSGEVERCPSLC